MPDGLRITVTDLATGDTEQRTIEMGDYCVVTAGSCYLDSYVHHHTGTVQLVLKGYKPGGDHA